MGGGTVVDWDALARQYASSYATELLQLELPQLGFV
jgi:hypothetical protein